MGCDGGSAVLPGRGRDGRTAFRRRHASRVTPDGDTPALPGRGHARRCARSSTTDLLSAEHPGAWGAASHRPPDPEPLWEGEERWGHPGSRWGPRRRAPSLHLFRIYPLTCAQAARYPAAFCLSKYSAWRLQESGPGVLGGPWLFFHLGSTLLLWANSRQTPREAPC